MSASSPSRDFSHNALSAFARRLMSVGSISVRARDDGRTADGAKASPTKADGGRDDRRGLADEVDGGRDDRDIEDRTDL